MRPIVIALAVLGACLFLTTALSANTMNTLRNAILRDSPSFLGKALETISSGTSIVLMNEEGAWAKVQAGGKQGWLPTSALRARSVSLEAGESRAKTSADSTEVILAGKGFSQKTEAEYRAKNPTPDYATVDMMEGYVVASEDREAFLRAGREGGAQ